MESIKKWFTGADAKGAATRTVLSLGGMIVFILGIMNADPEFIEFVKSQVGPVATAVGGLVWLISEGYRILYKTSSDKGHAVAVAVDKAIAEGDLNKSDTVTVKTPAGKPDIKVTS